MVYTLFHTTQHKNDLRTTLGFLYLTLYTGLTCIRVHRVLATRALHSFLLLPTGQHLHSYPTSGHHSQCCPSALMCFRYSLKIIPNVLIPNYALLVIYPVTVPNQANYNQYHHHVLLVSAFILVLQLPASPLWEIRSHISHSFFFCLDPNFLAWTCRSWQCSQGRIVLIGIEDSKTI